ncbi:outer membrane insertion C-terminal signal [Duganella sp. CF402]|uniref:porin family protein n=1 Tax=unclassified Duganella TaxID=2636909 RepID=UPI0008B1CB29|nr:MULTISPECIES: porin family protein [unclassified Duganella]RZT00747.1 putative outer membrane protein [Duganella sp. BK701]SEN24920.1 outer membrane insertion C-terminal signal [Duganella sp. CF402]
MRRMISATLLGLLATTPAFAQSFEPGVYLSADIGRASISSKYADNSGDATLSAAAGYQYTPNFGFEVYTRGLSLNPFRGVFAPAGYYPDTHYGIAALGTAHLDQHFRLYGRVGIGRTSMKGNRTGMADRDETDPIFGVGVGYGFNRNWSLNLEASYLTKTDVSLVTFGVRYQF